MYNVYNAQGDVVEEAKTQLEAFEIIDWLTCTETDHGPFHCAPALVLA